MYTFLSAVFFVALSGVIQKVLLSNHKDIGICIVTKVPMYDLQI